MNYVLLFCFLGGGGKGLICGSVDTHLADGCVPTKQRKCQVFLLSLMRACPRLGLWTTGIWLSHEKAEIEFPTL
jgi:hypothetical protein